MTRFVVHVGPHKTGSTYLQEAFAQFRPRLAGRGIHYPTAWGPTTHHALIDRLRTVPNPKLEAEFAELHAAGHPTVLISVEGLTGLPEASVAYLHGLIGPAAKVSVVFYARAWADILPSHWKESVKTGDTATFPEYLYARLHNPLTSGFVNFGMGLRNWSSVFGMEALRLVAYNHLVTTGHDLFTHFARQFLDWPDPPTPSRDTANVSPGTGDIEVVRALMVLERARVGTPASRKHLPALAAAFLARREDLTTPVIASALEENKASLVINETSPALMGLHRSLFAEFQSALVPPHLPNFFFRPRRAEPAYITPNWLLAQGVSGQLRTILQALRPQIEAATRKPRPG